ncbi:MAG TPA: sialidase family protein [Candidatus Thermoplasmatota archaeon]|nr:sialidase family protein [Candidatus Thermoplasmatota archaeon]
MARGLLLVCVATLVSFAIVPLVGSATHDATPRLALGAHLQDDVVLPAGTVSGGAEPIIHVTRDGTTLLVGDSSGVYRSVNGGATWTRLSHPFLQGAFTDGRAIAEDDVGRIYVAHTQGQIVGVARSSDNGASWDLISRVVAVGAIADRPWLAARGDGEVTLIVYNAGHGEECFRSTDGGATFLDRTLITPGVANTGGMAYDPQGRLWYSNGASWYRWTTCLQPPLPVDHPNGGAQILTQTAVDAQGRPYSALPSGNNAQMLVHARQTTGGVKTLAVSPAELKSNTFGAIAVNNATGEVAVGWYGSTTAGNPSASTFGGSWHVYVARITGFWSASPSVTVTQVTTTPNHVGGFCMTGVTCGSGADRDLLDYFGLTFAPDGSVHVAYGHDGATSNSEVRYAKLA